MIASARLAAALLLALVAAPPAAAGSITPISKIDWQQNQRVDFRWRDDAVPPAWMRAAILVAAEDANDSRRANGAFLDHDAGGASWVAYTLQLPDASALAYASRRAPDLFKVWLRPHGYAFDWGTLRWCQFYDNPPDGCFDAEMVGLHEFGHVHGLGHIEDAADPGDWLDSVMHTISRTKPKQGWNAHAFGACDVAALQVRYELLTPFTPVSSCLSLPTTLTLASSATYVQSGGSLTFSAGLRIADSVGYARLASDPLSGRRILLQRRSPGSTSWATHAVMSAAAAAGAYRLTVAASATYEWRALFSHPDEGLRGDASSILTVKVGSSCAPYCF